MNIFYKPVDVNASRVSLDEAIMYCAFLDHKGMKVWRLPTYEEVLEICEHRKEKRAEYYIYHPKYVWTTSDLEVNDEVRPNGISRVLAVRSKNDKDRDTS